MLLKNSICVFIIGLVMFLLPWITLIIGGWEGIGMLIILFLAVNPAVSLLTGIYSGLNIKSSWFCPLILAVLHILGAWLIFQMGEMAFVVYAIIYFLIGAGAMLLTSFIVNKLKNK